MKIWRLWRYYTDCPRRRFMAQLWGKHTQSFLYLPDCRDCSKSLNFDVPVSCITMQILILGSGMGWESPFLTHSVRRVVSLVLDHLWVPKAKREFFLPSGMGWGEWRVGKFPSHQLKSESFFLLHFLNPKGKINSVFFFSPPCLHLNRLPLWTAWGRALCIPEGLVQLCPSVFQQTPLEDELQLGKCRTFDLLRKALYCLLQKCPEAASFPSWGFKHMMAIYLFSVLSNSFSFLWFGTGERAAPEWPLLAIHYPIDLY